MKAYRGQNEEKEEDVETKNFFKQAMLEDVKHLKLLFYYFS